MIYNEQIADLLRRISVCLIIENEKKNYFRIIAYKNAADNIDNLEIELYQLWKKDQLKNIPGIGTSIAGYLEELFKKGRVLEFEKLFAKTPKAVFDLIKIPSIGPKRANFLVKSLNIKGIGMAAIDQLEKAAISNKITGLEGFGEKSQELILKSLRQYRAKSAKGIRFNIFEADSTAQEIILYLKQNREVITVEVLGSTRRRAYSVKDIDIAVASKHPKGVIDWFIKYPKVYRIIEAGDRMASILTQNNIQVDLRVQLPESFGSLLAHFTGSKEHNIRLRQYALKKGWSISEYGIKGIRKSKEIKPFASEENFYQTLGMDWITPELREDSGEIEASLNHQLPNLVAIDDIKGDLHIHSDFNLEPSHDLGMSTFEEIIARAKEKNYQYIGLSDHSPSFSTHNQNQIYDILIRRNEYFEQKKLKTKGVRVFKMLEVDILANGNLSINNKCLSLLDAGIGSIHSGFNQDSKTLTKRVLNALENPKIKIIGHPSGRLFDKRESYSLDWEEIFQACLKYNKALEINAYPYRLDLPDSLIHEAVKRGVKMVINSDAHHHQEMEMISYGIDQARRGWATGADILNTLSYNDFNRWLTAY